MRDLQVITDAAHLCVGDTIEEVYKGAKRFRVTPKPRAQRKVWKIRHHALKRPARLGNIAYATEEEAIEAVAMLLPYGGGYWSYSIVEVDG